MKINPFIDILLNWSTMPNSKKKGRLQDYENMLARRQNRKPRKFEIATPKIIEHTETDMEAREAGAFYSRNNPSKMYLLRLDPDGMTNARFVTHEGFHAYMHDYISGKCDLKLFSVVDKELLYSEERDLADIKKGFTDAKMLPLFDIAYIEERLNHQETSLIMIELLLEAIETPKDSEILLEYFIYAIEDACINEQRIKEYERLYGVKYEDVKAHAIANYTEQKVKISRAKKVVDNINPELLTLFEEAKKIYHQITENNDNLLLIANTDSQTKIKENLRDRFGELYYGYVRQMLQRKIKF